MRGTLSASLTPPPDAQDRPSTLLVASELAELDEPIPEAAMGELQRELKRRRSDAK